MSFSAFESSDLPAPESELPTPAPGETIYLQITATSLRRVRVATELVQHPGHIVQELRSRLVPGSPTRTTVVVSDRRVSLGEKTYQPDHLVSLSSAQHAKSVGCAFLLVGMGALMFVVSACASLASAWAGDWPRLTSFFVPLLLVGIGYVLYQSAKEHYAVYISLSSGEVDGLMSADQDTIAQIYDAIYQVLLQRGHPKAVGGDSPAV